MISIGYHSFPDWAGGLLDRFSISANLTAVGHVQFTIEQGIETGQPWGSTTTLMSTLSLADTRALANFLTSVSACADACVAASSDGIRRQGSK